MAQSVTVRFIPPEFCPDRVSRMITLTHVEFRYEPSGFGLHIMHLHVETGSRTVIVGPSGCGKSTLLQLVTGILIPSSGSVVVGDRDIAAMTDAQRREFRIASVGLIFQEFELLDYLNTAQNIELPWLLNPTLKRDHAFSTRIHKLAEELEISSKLNRPVTRLSHGERQRVAIGRALITQPTLVVADEPTGHLDPATRDRIMDLLFEQTRDRTLMMTTHDHSLLGRFDRVIDFSSPTDSGIELLTAEAASVGGSS
jgi:putative ABC transport system ATP-binding protein